MRINEVVLDHTVDPVTITGQGELALDSDAYSVGENLSTTFNIDRSQFVNERVSVDWAITNANVTPNSGTVIFEIGDTSKAIQVTAGAIGPTEVGTLTLSNPQNLSGGQTPALISPSSASFTIVAELSVDSSTFQSIGMVWHVGTQDSDHNATVSVRYAKLGPYSLSLGSNLHRNDYEWHWGQTPPPPSRPDQYTSSFAGSLMFLTPGTTYVVELTYNDPDGTDPNHGRVITFQTATRAIPVKPADVGTNIIYVDNSVAGPGSGTDIDPYNTLQLANDNASPGTRVKIRTGSGKYARATYSTSGAEENWIVYEPDTGHSPVIFISEIQGDHIWFDRLTVTGDAYTGNQANYADWENTTAFLSPNGVTPDDIIVTNCNVTSFCHWCHGFAGGSRWVAMDNTAVGPWPVGRGNGVADSNSTSRGFTAGGEGNVIAYNDISRFSDGCGMGANADTYGNKIHDCADDAVSTDGAEANLRLWGNMLQNCAGPAYTFQPQKSGPWYVLYNQMADCNLGIWKFRVQDRVVEINNTFVGATGRAQYFMKFFSRNNLRIGQWGGRDITINSSHANSNSAPQWYADWNTDIDYDGFDWGGGVVAFYWFDVEQIPGQRVNYSSIADWRTAVTANGVTPQQNAKEVDADLIFDDYTIDTSIKLTLKSDAAYGGPNPAANAGQLVNNLADWHGATPDFGWAQQGEAAPHIGPRAGTELIDKVEHWVKH